MGESGRGDDRRLPAAGPSARRAIARALVLILAGLAVAGTSPAPTRSPSIQAEATGTLILDADHPMSSVEVTVLANAAVLSDPTNQTNVRLERTLAAAAGPTNALAVVAFEAIDRPPEASAGQPGIAVGSYPSRVDGLTGSCASGADCTRRYRITAALAGPADGTLPVGWRVVIESRVGTDQHPGATPAGSALSVRASDPVAFADRSVSGSVSSEGIRIDAGHPRSVREVTFVRPGATDATVAAVLRTTIEQTGPDKYAQVAMINVLGPDATGSTTALNSGDADVVLPPCTDASGCRTTMRVVVQYRGGSPGNGATVAWTLGSVLFATDPAGAGSVGGFKLDAGDLAESRLVPAGSSQGTIVTGGNVIQNRTIAVSIRGVAGTTDGAGLFVQAAMAAPSRSQTGSKAEIIANIGGAAAVGKVGDELRATSGLVPMTCAGGTCTGSIPLSVWSYQSPAKDVTVDWRLDGALVIDPGVTVDPASTLTFADATSP